MDIDVRPVPVDKLVGFSASELASRHKRLIELREEFQARLAMLKTELEEVEKISTFIQTEYDHVVLAERLLKEDVVRVVCPSCKGSGMRPANVLGGQIHKGGAFESVGKPVSASVVDERNRCQECQGQRWIIMDRFKG